MLFRSRSLKKSLHIFKHTYRLFQQKKHKLTPTQLQVALETLQPLQEALLHKDKQTAYELAKKAQELGETTLARPPFEKALRFIVALAVTLGLAIVIRQVWFEPYEIPTGSMRPTLKEKDRLVVSKTAFGVNMPLCAEHIFFDPSLVQRNGIITFTGENMDIEDVDTRYFFLFPGKKQYIKRMIGKPGDTLYFYGGLIYGIDAEGNDISKELQISSLDRIEHIPFLQFDGKVCTPDLPSNGIYSPVILRQMNEPIAKLVAVNNYQAKGEMLPIVVDTDVAGPALQNYGDLWGIHHFGMARLLTKEQTLRLTHETLATLPITPLYLEIKHHPTLKDISIQRDLYGRLRPTLRTSSTVIPISNAHMETLFNNLYTSRFVVENGVAYSYGAPKPLSQKEFLPKLSGVPNGTYEFYDGKAYEVLFEGVTKELPSTHPLCLRSPERAQLFYNLGMEFDTRFSPASKYPLLFPSRYVYFRHGDLYAMGASLFSSQDIALTQFIQREKSKQSSTYEPFIDHGPPLKEDGSLDLDLLHQYGIVIPKNMYLVLGDNHARSADCRVFGFVPAQNLRGVPDWIFWPPGARWGHPNQPSYPFFNFPRTCIWVLASISISLGLYYQRRRYKLPVL